MITLRHKIIFISILFIGIIFRLYRLDKPIADWHSHRQADTASVSRIYSLEGVNLLYPRYYDLSNLQSGLDNPLGYRFVEFPIYNVLSVLFHQIFKTNIEISSRFVSIIFSIGSAILIYLISYQQYKLYFPAIMSFLFFLLLPFNTYYSRAILPEPYAVFTMLAALYFFKINLILSSIFLSLSILTKPFTAIIIFPILILFFAQNYFPKINYKVFIKLLIFTLISVLPFIFWRNWISNFPEGIPQSDWLLNNANTTTFPNWFHGYDLSFLNKLVAFRPHWFYWLFEQRLAILILGSYSIIPFFLGLSHKKNHHNYFSFSIALGILLYFIIVAQGNIQHDYYQVLIIPSVSLICGFGYNYLYQYLFPNKTISIILIFFIFSLSFYFSWNQIKGYYQINNPKIVTVGQTAQMLLPSNSLIVAPYQGDTALLYQTGFRGWPIEIYDFNKLLLHYPNNPIYLVSVNYDQYTNNLISNFPVITKHQDYVILKISK